MPVKNVKGGERKRYHSPSPGQFGISCLDLELICSLRDTEDLVGGLLLFLAEKKGKREEEKKEAQVEPHATQQQSVIKRWSSLIRIIISTWAGHVEARGLV